MDKASRILAIIGVGFGILAGAFFIVIAILGFIGSTAFYPSFLPDTDEIHILFNVIILFYGFFEIGVGFLAIFQYLFTNKGKYDLIICIFFMVLAVLTANIPFIASLCVVLPYTNR